MFDKKLLGALAAGALLFAACSDDGGSGGGDSNAYSDALAESMRAEEELPFADEDIDCLAVEFVDAVGGPSALEDAGIDPEDLSSPDDLSDSELELGDEEAEKLAGSFGECGVSIADIFLSEMGDEVTDEQRSCVEDNLDEDELADFLAQSIVGGGENADELPSGVMEELIGCFS